MMRIDVDEWQIRSFRTQDAEALARYANNRNVSRNLRDEFPYPYTLAHAETWISFAAQQSTESDFAIASETELIGGIGLRIQRDVHRRSAEVGYWLGEPFWGRGIATAALRAFTEYAFSQFDLLRLYGCQGRRCANPIFPATIGPAEGFIPAYSGISAIMRLDGAVSGPSLISSGLAIWPATATKFCTPA